MSSILDHEDEAPLTFRLTKFLGSLPFLIGEGVALVSYLTIITVTKSLTLFIAFFLLLGLQTVFSTLLVLRNQWRQEEREARERRQYEADLMTQDHTLQDVKGVLHAVHEHLGDIDERLKIVYGDLLVIKQDEKERARELHRLDQLFALQSTATRSEGILTELITLTRRIDERKQQRRRRYAAQSVAQPEEGGNTMPLEPEEVRIYDLHTQEETRAGSNREGEWESQISH